jgi:hypothetical protein
MESELELVEVVELVMMVVVIEAVLVSVDVLLELLALLVAEGAAGPFVQERGRMRGRALGGFAAGVNASRKPCGLVAGLV